ncbi:Uncharacterised protein [Mycobacterium tuberculosis]|uniref:Uncharacterized protein n=2 Tax=Mycobacterium tuberculosis TaxID=1773 RepID=A0A655J5H9_MYCTX|nr:Uncharacterised protein [Mycobacterium tuberculosis]COY39235.1 Uncharacterised protein [Mycobacterium tuberculosis]
MGTVTPLLAPSWLTAEPRTTARMRLPSRTASSSRLSTTTAAPSPRTYPSADASKVLHRPSGDSIPHREQAMLGPGLSKRLVPPTNAISLSRPRRLWHARCTATNDDEQAVSMTTAGPRAPRM